MLKNIRNVRVTAKVVEVKDSDAKVVTHISFQYDGEPSQVNTILLAEAQNVPVNARMYSEQIMMELDDEDEPAMAGKL
jgi:hypothetical protein